VLEVDPRHQPFVPNDAGLDVEEDHLVLLTGPNMGGKSTYLRQVALIALMAHLGSWVPARRAVIGRVDRLFCRVGAGDSLMRGLSTFMVEMTETAAILRNATKASLVILDEVGRGTSTYDGMAIAWAVVEALAGPEGIGCRTLFATHYHELTQLGRSMGGVVNRTMGVREYAGKVHFLRTVEPGAADRSYGIHVAELAGVPQPVVARAWALLEDMESSRRALHPPATPGPKQESLFEDESFGAGEEILRVLRGLDLARTAPMEALLILDRLKKKAKSP
jgi:DNA mismatch repair protein MutS